MTVQEQMLPYRLRGMMGLYGVRPAEVARRTGLDNGYLSRLLKGEIKPTPATVRRIVLAINAEYLGNDTQGTAA